jgi:hypothetical protein
MPNQAPWLHSDVPAEAGPDYVALVIEWDDGAEDVNQVTPRVPPIQIPSIFKKIAIGAGALGALLFARWGIRRLRHA